MLAGLDSLPMGCNLAFIFTGNVQPWWQTQLHSKSEIYKEQNRWFHSSTAISYCSIYLRMKFKKKICPMWVQEKLLIHVMDQTGTDQNHNIQVFFRNNSWSSSCKVKEDSAYFFLLFSLYKYFFSLNSCSLSGALCTPKGHRVTVSHKHGPVNKEDLCHAKWISFGKQKKVWITRKIERLKEKREFIVKMPSAGECDISWGEWLLVLWWQPLEQRSC